jgi:flagellar basal-body rod modification protein FlgD
MYINSAGTDYRTDVTGDPASPVKIKKEVGKDDFLHLLVTQLKYQDPLNPMESQEFSSQLAQFSSLEKLTAIDETLLEIKKSLGAKGNEDLLGYIGKSVKTEDNTINVAGGIPDSGEYYLESPADVEISVYNSLGSRIRTIESGFREAGRQSIGWDGRDDRGNRAADGSYTVGITAVNQAGEPVPAEIYHTGEVTGVTNQNNIPHLMVGGRPVLPGDIIEIMK